MFVCLFLQASTSEAAVVDAAESVEPPAKRQRRAAAQKAITTLVETESDEENVDDVLPGSVAKVSFGCLVFFSVWLQWQLK